MIAFPLQCRALALPEPEPEHRFAPPRRWRFDWAWPRERLAMEIQGGLYLQGRHVRGAALEKEHEKLNTAAAMGWRVLYVQPKHLKDGSAVRWAEVALSKAGRYDQLQAGAPLVTCQSCPRTYYATHPDQARQCAECRG